MFTFSFPNQLKNFRPRTNGNVIFSHKFENRNITSIAKLFSNFHHIKFSFPVKISQRFFTRRVNSFRSVRSIFVSNYFFKPLLFISTAKANVVKKIIYSLGTFNVYMANVFSIRWSIFPFASVVPTRLLMMYFKMIKAFFGLLNDASVSIRQLGIASVPVCFFIMIKDDSAISIKSTLKPAFCKIVSHCATIIPNHYPVMQE